MSPIVRSSMMLSDRDDMFQNELLRSAFQKRLRCRSRLAAAKIVQSALLPCDVDIEPRDLTFEKFCCPDKDNDSYSFLSTMRSYSADGDGSKLQGQSVCSTFRVSILRCNKTAVIKTLNPRRRSRVLTCILTLSIRCGFDILPSITLRKPGQRPF